LQNNLQNRRAPVLRLAGRKAWFCGEDTVTMQ